MKIEITIGLISDQSWPKRVVPTLTCVDSGRVRYHRLLKPRMASNPDGLYHCTQSILSSLGIGRNISLELCEPFNRKSSFTANSWFGN
jgi:hypothetical protein